MYVTDDGLDGSPDVIMLPEARGEMAVPPYCPPEMVQEVAFSVFQDNVTDSGVSISGGAVGEYVNEFIFIIGWHLPPTHLKSAPYAVVQELITK